MKPSPEAIEAAARAMRKVETDALGVIPLTKGDVLRPALDAAYAVDMPNVELPLTDALRELVEEWDGDIAWIVFTERIRDLLAQHTGADMTTPDPCVCTTTPNREAAMVTLERNSRGVATVWCDPCIAPLVKALNDGGLPTVASCCGHGTTPGWIALRDDRTLLLTDFDTAHVLMDHAMERRARQEST
jgi:hypothetical protein